MNKLEHDYYAPRERRRDPETRTEDTMYRFLITDTKPQLHACTYAPSVRAPNKMICTSENGLALVVEPGGLVRDLRPGEEADSPWCWADACGDLLVYRPDEATIVAFRMVVPA